MPRNVDMGDEFLHLPWRAVESCGFPKPSNILTYIFTDGMTVWVGHAGESADGCRGFYGYNSWGGYRDGDHFEQMSPHDPPIEFVSEIKYWYGPIWPGHDIP